MKKSHTQKICICAILAALFVPLEWLASNFGKIAFLDSYQIPISCFPLILASVLFGVKWGVATAVVGSFVSQIIISAATASGIGITTLLWMVPTVVYALVVAVLYNAFGKSDKIYLLAVEFFISSFILSCLNIGALYLDSIIVGYPYNFLNGFFKLIMSLKLVGGIIFAVIFAVIVPPIIKKVKAVIKI